MLYEDALCAGKLRKLAEELDIFVANDGEGNDYDEDDEEEDEDEEEEAVDNEAGDIAEVIEEFEDNKDEDNEGRRRHH